VGGPTAKKILAQAHGKMMPDPRCCGTQSTADFDHLLHHPVDDESAKRTKEEPYRKRQLIWLTAPFSGGDLTADLTGHDFANHRRALMNPHIDRNNNRGVPSRQRQKRQ